MINLDIYLQTEIDGNIYVKNDLLDLIRLQKQLLIEENLLCTIEDCANIWLGYSNDLSASWLFFPANDKEIIPAIKCNSYFVSFGDYL